MSAFICNDWHINTLVNYGCVKRVRTWYAPICRSLEFTDPQGVAETLLAENYRSVNYRYNENGDPPAINYSPFQAYTTDPVHIIKACDCYGYQACESPDYEESRAYALIKGIREYAIHHIPGYDDADAWELRAP